MSALTVLLYENILQNSIFVFMDSLFDVAPHTPHSHVEHSIIFRVLMGRLITHAFPVLLFSCLVSVASTTYQYMSGTHDYTSKHLAFIIFLRRCSVFCSDSNQPIGDFTWIIQSAEY